MTTPTFKPVFGPNGAVMNAPSMTPEMREKLERSARPPTLKDIRRELGSFAFAGLVATAFSLSGGVYEFLKSSPWWSGAFAGALVSVAFGAIWRTVDRNLSRWELRSSQHAFRRLRLPEWGRWSLAVTDTLAIGAYVVFFAGMLADLDRQYWTVWSVIGFVAGLLATLGLTLRWYADRRKWQWRVDVA